MFQPEHKLKHLTFFEEIASHEESDPAWRAATAGLVVLRLVDSWIEEGPAAFANDEWSRRSVRGAIEEINDRSQLASVLFSVVDAMENSDVVDLRLIGPRLMAYAQLLEYDASWNLAADVYQAIIAHTHPVQDADIASQAQLRLGVCYRQLGNLAASLRAYQIAGSIAHAADDMVGVLRARIGEAKAAIARGNMPQAGSILDETIASAAHHQLKDVRSMALHDRSMVAHLSGDYELAIGLAYEALETTEAPRDRDRILGDIATSFYKLGVWSAARDAYLILSVTAQEQYGRWAAMLNLMELAAESGDEMMFEAYRRAISPDRMPPQLQTSYWISLGVGAGRFNRIEDARTYLARALAIAEEHELNQMAFEVEAELKALGTKERTAQKRTELPHETVQHIADVLRERRQGVGV